MRVSQEHSPNYLIHIHIHMRPPILSTYFSTIKLTKPYFISELEVYKSINITFFVLETIEQLLKMKLNSENCGHCGQQDEGSKRCACCDWRCRDLWFFFRVIAVWLWHKVRAGREIRWQWSHLIVVANFEDERHANFHVKINVAVQQPKAGIGGQKSNDRVTTVGHCNCILDGCTR